MPDYIYPNGEAPDDVEYVLTELSDDLPNGKLVVPGPGISITVGANDVTISNTGGAGQNATYITANDETSNLPNSFQIVEGANINLDYVGDQLIISASVSGSGGGTVESVSSQPTVGTLFTTSVATATTTPAISYTISNAASGTFFSGPASGVAAAGIYRGILGTDLSGALTAGTGITLTPAVAPGSRLTVSVVGFQPLSSVLNALASSLTGTGYVVQTGPDSFAERTFQDSAYVTITNPAGVAGNSTINLSTKVLTTDSYDLLNALATSTGNGILVRTGLGTVSPRTIQGTTGNIDVTNGSGVGGDPTINVGARVFTVATSSLLNALSSATAGGTGGIYQLSDTAFINRSLTGTTNRVVITNPNGLAGAPTFDVGSDVYTISSSNVLNALATGLTGTGFVAQNGTVFADRSLTGTGNRITITNPTGAGGNPVFDLGTDALTISSSNVLNDLASSTSTGIMVQTDAVGHHAYRTLAGTSGEINITNPSGVTGAPTFSLDSSVYTERDSSLLNYLASSAPNLGEIPMGTTDGHYLLTKPNAGPGAQLAFANGIMTISATGAQGGTLTSLTVGDISPLWDTNVSNPTTTPTVSFTLNDMASGAVLIGPFTGADTPGTLRRLLGHDVTDAIEAGSNITFSMVGDQIVISSTASGGGGGTVLTVDAQDLPPLFTTDVSNPSTTPDITFTLSDAASGTFFSGPASGGPSPGSYRLPTGLDLIPALSAGTNITMTMVGDRLRVALAGPIDATLVADGSVNNTEFQYLGGVTSDIQTQFSNKQPLDATLTALSGFNSNGFVVQTAPDTFTSRNIEGFSGQVVVTNGDGDSGNPVISLDSGILSALATGVQSVAVGNLAPIFTSNVSDPTTTPSVTYTLANGASGTFLAFPASGVNGPLSAREIVGSDIDQALQAGSNITLTLVDDKVVIAATGSTGYTTVEEEGTPLTQRSTINFVGAGINAADVASKTQISLDATLNSLASFSATGIMVSQGSDTFVGREISGTANQVTVANGTGISGNIVVGLDSGIDPALLADGSVSNTEFQYINSLSSNVQTQLDGKQALSNTLNALATGAVGIGYVIRTAPDTFIDRSLATANSNHITISNVDGVAGASTFDIGANVYTNETHSLLNYLASSTPDLGEIPMGTSDNHYLLTKPNAGTGVQLDFANGVFTISATGAGTGSGGYTTIQEEGTPLTQRSTINFVGAGLTASDTGSLTQVSLDGTLNSLATYDTNGILTQTATDTFTGRTLTGTAGEVDVANGDGVAGPPTIGIADNVVLPGTAGVVLPTGTTAQQGSTNGQIRYNSDTSSFEGRAGGAWGPLGGGGAIQVVIKSTTEGVASSTTLQADDRLLIPIKAGEIWDVSADLIVYNSNATPDFKFTFSGPAGATGDWSAISTQANLTLGGSLGDTQVLNTSADVRYHLVCGAKVDNSAGSDGALVLQWAQNTSNANPTYVSGISRLIATKVN